MSRKEPECVCPYCGSVLPIFQKFCKACQIELIRCQYCGGYMRKDSTICPTCKREKKQIEEDR